MTNSRNKGKRGELEWAKFLQSRGYKARRGQQYSGSPESPDVVCEELSEFHFEVKRVEKLNVYKAFEQAWRDAGGATPVVAHRRNGKNWLIIMDADDFITALEDGK